MPTQWLQQCNACKQLCHSDELEIDTRTKIALCPSCVDVYYKKCLHSPLFNLLNALVMLATYGAAEYICVTPITGLTADVISFAAAGFVGAMFYTLWPFLR